MEYNKELKFTPLLLPYRLNYSYIIQVMVMVREVLINNEIFPFISFVKFILFHI
jgi:hypothetical protein